LQFAFNCFLFTARRIASAVLATAIPSVRCSSVRPSVRLSVRLSVRHTPLSTIQDEKSAAKFHYIKTLSGKVVAQSIAFRVVSTYWQGNDPFPEILPPSELPLLKAASFDTFCLVAPQPQEIEKEVQLHLTSTRQGISNEPSTKVLRRP